MIDLREQGVLTAGTPLDVTLGLQSLVMAATVVCRSSFSDTTIGCLIVDFCSKPPRANVLCIVSPSPQLAGFRPACGDVTIYGNLKSHGHFARLTHSQRTCERL